MLEAVEKIRQYAAAKSKEELLSDSMSSSHPLGDGYSARSAVIGSTREALRAGIQLATSTTPARSAQAPR